MKKILLIALIGTSFLANAQCWESISVGEVHVNGIKTDGTLWGWGQNGDAGIVGNGNTWTYNIPIQLGSSTDWKTVNAGHYHSFAIKDNGTLWGWGGNAYGELGIGTTTFSLLPVQIGTGSWKMVKSGSLFTTAIKADGTLWAWGNNQQATLGDGTFVSKSTPTLISSATNWKMVSNNQSRNIAIKTDGTLWVWGMNAPFLGLGSSYASQSHITVPTQLGTDTNWKTAAAGFGFFLAVKNDNTLWAWGGGDNGQLGNGTTTSSPLPIQIGTATDWETVEADSQSSFAIKTDGTLWAWGRNINGQLGNGTQTNLFIPTQITTTSDWQAISTGSVTTSSALKTDGSLYSWGSNQFGTLGDSTYVNQLSPLLINSCDLDTEDFGKNQKASLYPNPVQNNLFIDSQETQHYQIYSILGTKISEGMLSVGSSIDCSDLASGVYLVNLTNEFGGTKTLKFLKK